MKEETRKEEARGRERTGKKSSMIKEMMTF
jgi:hypothetical protein